MAITTYSELQTAVANWLLRSDLTSRITEFIALAEAMMNRDERLLSMSNVTRTTLAVSTQFTSLPAAFRSLIALQYEGDPDRQLQYVTPFEIDRWRVSQSGVTYPMVYSIIGTELEVAPVPSSCTLELIYYPNITALSVAAPTNWLLTNHPDLYLYSSLMSAAPYLHEDERAAFFAAAYERLAEGFKTNEQSRKWNASPLTIRPNTTFGE